MQCNDFQLRWQDLLDERSSPERDPALLQHAADCRTCREFLQLQSLLFAELARERIVRHRPLPSTKFARHRVETAAWISIAVAASLLVLLVPAWRVVNRDGSSRDGSSAHRKPMAQIAEHAAVDATPTAESPATPSAPSIASATPADHEAVGKFMEGVAATLSEVPDEPFEPLDTLAGGIRPLTNGLNAAWGAILRSIPEGQDQNKMAREPQEIWNWLRLKSSPA